MSSLRRKKLAQAIEKNKLDGLIISGWENIRYISGFTGSFCLLLMAPQKGYLFTDFRYLEQAEKETRGFEIVKWTIDEYKIMTNYIKMGRIGFEESSLTYQQFRKLKKDLGEIRLVPTQNLMEDLRIIKDEDEIRRIKKAVRISDMTFNHLLNFIKPGLTEQQIQMEIEFFMRKSGAEKVAFNPIVASGKNSSMPHYRTGKRKIRNIDLIKLDFGATYEGYHSDLTRTIFIGKVSAKKKKIYQIVKYALDLAEEEIRAGKKCAEIDKIVREYIKKSGYGKYFGHGLGHGVGLSVHERPTLSFISKEVLKPGMVFTLEPGIYLPNFGGVRIEDLVLLTEKGIQILTKSTKELIII